MAPINTAWVLVIEDLREQAELWADACTEAGVNAMTAATGLQGYRRARDTQPAVIVLDVALPDVDGWEICRRLKTDEQTKHIPIVIVTAWNDADGERRAAHAGCVAYLKKPYPPADLVALLKHVIADRETV